MNDAFKTTPRPNVRITAEFEYKPSDIGEAIRILSWRMVGGNLWRGLIGWAIFVAVAVFIYFSISVGPTKGSTRGPAGAAPSSWVDAAVGVLPWVLIFLVVWIVAFVTLRRRRRTSNPVLNRHWTLLVDDNGILLFDSMERSERSWALFTEARQTKNLYLLHMAKAYAVIIPKHAFANDGDADLFWKLAQERSHPRASAFPVLPMKQQG